jgi:hypothetical protein
MLRRLVWLVPLLIGLVTCALNQEGSGNVIPPSDAGSDARVDASIPSDGGGIVLAPDALIGQ